MGKIDHGSFRTHSGYPPYDCSLAEQLLHICQGLVNRHCDAFGAEASLEYQRGLTVHAGVDGDLLTVGVGFCEDTRLRCSECPTPWLGSEYAFIPEYVVARLDVAQARRRAVLDRIVGHRREYAEMLKRLGRVTWAVENFPVEFTLYPSQLVVTHPDRGFVEYLHQKVAAPISIDCVAVGFSDNETPGWFGA
ncbi:hypothetical protein [Mesorhizobium marinum]|uniref:Uncharacterized protein n=1 Tax=Mesorhizobium marinum TaxID=3228790 RepID=A0ABV3R3X0_9HYPH